MTEAELLVFGANESGQLGLEASDSVPVPRTPVALQSQQIMCVAFGFSHTLWLTSEGVVVVSGLNNVGQCGMSAPEQVLTPVRLEALATKRVQRVSAGGAFSAAVPHTGEVLTFGANDFGQCGQGDGAALELRKPRLVKGAPAACSVACGCEHMLLLDRQAEVLGCGLALALTRTRTRTRTLTVALAVALILTLTLTLTLTLARCTAAARVLTVRWGWATPRAAPRPRRSARSLARACSRPVRVRVRVRVRLGLGLGLG